MPFFFDDFDDDSEAAYQMWRWDNDIHDDWDEEDYEEKIVFTIN